MNSEQADVDFELTNDFATVRVRVQTMDCFSDLLRQPFGPAADV